MPCEKKKKLYREASKLITDLFSLYKHTLSKQGNTTKKIAHFFSLRQLL